MREFLDWIIQRPNMFQGQELLALNLNHLVKDNILEVKEQILDKQVKIWLLDNTEQILCIQERETSSLILNRCKGILHWL